MARTLLWNLFQNLKCMQSYVDYYGYPRAINLCKKKKSNRYICTTSFDTFRIFSFMLTHSTAQNFGDCINLTRKHLVISFYAAFHWSPSIGKPRMYDSGILRQDHGIIRGLPIGSHLSERTERGGPNYATDQTV